MINHLLNTNLFITELVQDPAANHSRKVGLKPNSIILGENSRLFNTNQETGIESPTKPGNYLFGQKSTYADYK